MSICSGSQQSESGEGESVWADTMIWKRTNSASP